MDFRRRLEEALARDRRDRIVFTVLAIALTPVLLVGAVAGILWAAHFADLPVIDHYGFRHGYLVGFDLFLLFMFISYFARPKERWRVAKSDFAWVGGAVAALAAALLLGHGTTLESTRPEWFWPIYGALAIAIFGMLGRAYQAKESYYLGWYGGLVGNPFTIEDDLDRGHFALGCAAAIPGMIFDAYGEIFGGAGLLRGASEEELRAAERLLPSLRGADDDAARAALRGLDPGRAARVLRRLESAGLVRMSGGRPVLTREGEGLI